MTGVQTCALPIYPAYFAPMFERALCYRLGSDLARVLKSSDALSDNLSGKYERALRVAARIDAKSSSQPKARKGSLFAARTA